MEQLLNKITSVSYDLFGVIVPGVIAILVWTGIYFAVFPMTHSQWSWFFEKFWAHEVSWISLLLAGGYFIGLVLRWMVRGHIFAIVTRLTFTHGFFEEEPFAELADERADRLAKKARAEEAARRAVQSHREARDQLADAQEALEAARNSKGEYAAMRAQKEAASLVKSKKKFALRKAREARGTALWRRWARFMLFRKPIYPARAHSPNMSLSYQSASARLRSALHLPDSEEWRPFYLVGKALAGEQMSKSLIATYQNKYTFHRSLAVTFALAAWAIAGLAVASGPDSALETLTFLAGMGAASIFVLISCHQFEQNWRNLGDAVIAETLVVLQGSHDARAQSTPAPREAGRKAS